MNQAKEGALNEQMRILQVQQLLQVILQAYLSSIRIFFCSSGAVLPTVYCWHELKVYLESYGYLSQL